MADHFWIEQILAVILTGLMVTLYPFCVRNLRHPKLSRLRLLSFIIFVALTAVYAQMLYAKVGTILAALQSERVPEMAYFVYWGVWAIIDVTMGALFAWAAFAVYPTRNTPSRSIAENT